jgi:hypothetical protein
MALVRFDKIAIDTDYVYAVSISKWFGGNRQMPDEILIFSDLPHITPGEPAVKIEGSSAAFEAWGRILQVKKFTVAGGLAFDKSKVCGVSIANDYSTGSIAFRFDDRRGWTLPLDAFAAGQILSVLFPIPKG